MVRAAVLRRDVDGLRGLAVTAVVTYHALPQLAPGGFAGVDVFFVISGYLITTLVVGARARHDFSFANFYARRARRLLPALAVVLAAVLVAAWALLSPVNVEAVARHALAGAAFVPNVLSWRDAGYFDWSADHKPLLHLWSLGVEEQFYLVWPALLLWTPRARLRAVAGLVTVGSFTLALWRADAHATETFYLLHTRLWEPALGGTLALCGELPRPLRTASAWLGVAMIGAGFATSTALLAWPGPWTLLPTLGTAFVIAGGADGWLNRRVLGATPLVAIGLISYPLYLWHWPLLSFAAMLAADPSDPTLRGTLVAAAVALAAITWALIERPVRGRLSTRRAVVPGLIGATGAVAALALLLESGTVPARLPAEGPDEVLAAMQVDDALSHRVALDGCGFSGLADVTAHNCGHGGDVKSPRRIVLWGDSHAAAWAPAWAQYGREHGLDVVLISAGACAPILGARSGDDPVTSPTECHNPGYGETVLGDIRQLHPERVVLIARWTMYTNGLAHSGSVDPIIHFLTRDPTGPATRESSQEALREGLPATVDALSAFTKVTILREWPQLAPEGSALDNLGHHGPFGYEPTLDEYRASVAFADTLIDQIKAKHPDLLVVDPAPYVCTPRCEAKHGGVWMYRDDNHISAAGSLMLMPVVATGL